MAFIQCDFFSETLQLSTSMNVILPQQTAHQIGMTSKGREGNIPTLYLFHGLSDDHTIWSRRTSIERYVAELGIAVVMPQVHRSFYTDMVYGGKYWTFISEELPRLARSFFPLSEHREDNFVAGLSMGGYGAFKLALSHPDRFAAAASLSGVLDLAARVNQPDLGPGPLDLVFGEQDIRQTADDLLWLLKQGEATAGPKPLLYQTCGTEDFLYNDNLTFQAACAKTSYQLTTDFGPGDHDWGYWDDKIQDVLNWLPLKGK